MREGRISILTVDDEAGLADFIQQILTAQGYTTFMETNGLAAINSFRINKPTVTLIDVSLGDLKTNGLDVLKGIKEIDPKAVCIILTRVTDERIVQRAKDLGALHYILKPFNESDILEIIKEAQQAINQQKEIK